MVEFLDAHLRSNRHNQSWKYRFLMQFQEFEELFEFYQNSIESMGGTKLESLRLFSNLKVPLARYFSGPKRIRLKKFLVIGRTCLLYYEYFSNLIHQRRDALRTL